MSVGEQLRDIFEAYQSHITEKSRIYIDGELINEADLDALESFPETIITTSVNDPDAYDILIRYDSSDDDGSYASVYVFSASGNIAVSLYFRDCRTIVNPISYPQLGEFIRDNYGGIISMDLLHAIAEAVRPEIQRLADGESITKRVAARMIGKSGYAI